MRGEADKTLTAEEEARDKVILEARRNIDDLIGQAGLTRELGVRQLSAAIAASASQRGFQAGVAFARGEKK